MEWYKNLYLGENAAKKHYKLFRRIRKKRLSNAYVITLPSNEANILDIYSYNELLWKHYNNRNLFIVGLACGKDEAVELTRDIIQDVYSSTGAFDVKKYVMSR